MHIRGNFSFRFGTRAGIALGVSVAAFIAALTVAFLELALVKVGIGGAISDQQFRLLSGTAKAIDRQLLMQQALLNAVSTDFQENAPRDPAQVRELLLRQTLLKQRFRDCFVFDAKAEYLANLTQPVISTSRMLSNRELISDAIASGTATITIGTSTDKLGEPMVIYTMPVRNQQGEITHVLAASMELSFVNLAAHLESIRPGQDGYVYLSTEDGVLLAHSDPDRALKTVAYEGSEGGEHRKMNIGAATQEGTVKSTNVDGADYWITTKKLESTNWVLNAVMPDAEFASSLGHAEAIVPAASLLLALVAGLLTWCLMTWRSLPTDVTASKNVAAHTVDGSQPIVMDAMAHGSAGPASVRAIWNNDDGLDAASLMSSDTVRMLAHELLDHVPIGIFMQACKAGEEGPVVAWNKTAASLLGFPAELLVTGIPSAIFPLDLASTINRLSELTASQPDTKAILESLVECRDGMQRYLRFSSVFVDTADGMDYTLTVVEDLTEACAQQTLLRAKEAELAAFSAASPLGFLCCDRSGRCTYANQALEAISGLSLARMRGKKWLMCIHPEDRFRVWHDLASHSDDESSPATVVCRLLRDNGQTVWISIKSMPITIDGSICGYVGCIEDITTRRTSELALLKSEQRLRLITDNIPALVAYVTPDERVAFANRRYEEAFGILHEELFGMRTWEVLGPQVYAISKPFIQEVLTGKPVHFERQVLHGDAVRYERVRYIPDIDSQGKVAGYFGLVDDITELKLVEEQLRKLVRFDSLTGLANRTQFNEKLVDAMRHSRRNETLMAILFLDIDHFKQINDSLGHQGGDEVLREFAQRLLGCVRETDTVARLAGDEFVIILEGLSAPEEAFAVARKIIAAMAEDFKVMGAARTVTTSVGIAVRRGDEEDAQGLLKRADDALYRAKSAGRNTFESLN